MSGLGLWRKHRQVVGLAVLAVVVALGCVGLGRWQWHRYQVKHQRKEVVERGFAAPPAPLDRLLASPDAPLQPDAEWRAVRVDGRYAVDRTILVRNRPRDIGGTDPAYGYEVLVPLVLADGTAMVVDRGWVPNGTSGTNPAEEPDQVDPPTSGPVQVVVRLRPSEPTRPGRTPPGQVGSIALPQVSARTGLDLYQAYGVLVSESPSTTPAPALVGKPELDGGEGINASYAVQWVLFAAMALGFPFWWLRRQRREAQEVSAGPGPAAGSPVPLPTAPRKRRIWDDEEA